VLANLTVRNTYGALHGDHDHYYWQIDELTPDGTIPGHMWQFTTPAAASGPSAAGRR
jgi:hypothetical protein